MKRLVDFPSINSEYINTCHESLPSKVDVTVAMSVARADPPQAAVAKTSAIPSFSVPNPNLTNSNSIENRRRPNHTDRFIGAPIVPVVNPTRPKVCYSGINLCAAYKMLRIFAPDYDIEPWKTIVSSDSRLSTIVPGFKFDMCILNEQVRINEITLSYALKRASVVIFHFDLSNANNCQDSYDISIGRIKLCRHHADWRNLQFCMIGIADENKTSSDALEIFNKFKSESDIENVLVFNPDSGGEESLREFMLKVFSKPDVSPGVEESSEAREGSCIIF